MKWYLIYDKTNVKKGKKYLVKAANWYDAADYIRDLNRKAGFPPHVNFVIKGVTNALVPFLKECIDFDTRGIKVVSAPEAPKKVFTDEYLESEILGLKAIVDDTMQGAPDNLKDGILESLTAQTRATFETMQKLEQERIDERGSNT
jgi:hypothetical protein